MHVTKNSSWLEHVWTSCRPDDGLNEGAETCCRTKNSIKKNVGQFGYNTAVFCDCPILSIYFCQHSGDEQVKDLTIHMTHSWQFTE